MSPLFFAVYHGCRAGRYTECRREVYRDRILRGNQCYLLNNLGAFGTDISLLASFFETPWTQPVATLSPSSRSWMISQAGFSLRAVGRLADAVEPMQAGAQAYVKSEDWSNAASSYSNLSELHLSLGNLAEALGAARQSVDFADRSGEKGQKMSMRTTLANALHQTGDLTGAMRLFEEAERLQAEYQPENPILYSYRGYGYCDLLLGKGRPEEVLRRASQTLLNAEGNQWLLDIGLDRLSLGRANRSGSPEAALHFHQAVDFLRRAGQLDVLPLALLARGTPHDLDEVFRIATRSGMRLHLTDYHLASARLALRHGDRAQAHEHFAKAEALIHETGYDRRDPDLAELRPKCT
jgi:tetratricopeptide (TPR) repeat protein